MTFPSAIYILKPILTDDPRFDGFIFGDVKPTPAWEAAYQVFEVDHPMSIHWQPRRPSGEWKPLPVTGPVKPFNDYPCLNLLIPAFRHRAVDALGPILTDNGQLLALQTEVGEYYGYVGSTKIEALDLKKTRLWRSHPEQRSDQIEYYSFVPKMLSDATIFRIPEKPNGYLVTDVFKERVEQAKLNGFHFIPIWPLPEDSDWMMEETYRRRKAKRIKLVGEALMLRFFLENESPTQRERRMAAGIEESLREQLKVCSLEDRYWGSIEATSYEAGEFRIVCTCPSGDELEARLARWLENIAWANGILCVKRYGNLYAGRAKERSVEIRKPNRFAGKPVWLRSQPTSEQLGPSSQSSHENMTGARMVTHSENELLDEMPDQIRESAVEALRLLGLDEEADSTTIVQAIDRFVYAWQCGERPTISWDVEDVPYYLGSLWGEQLVRQFGWEWRLVTFHEHDDSQAPGLVSPDRSLAIYPIHFIIGCLNNASVDATILLSFNMLKEGTANDSKAGAYDNLMAQVFRIVPRVASMDRVENEG